MGKAANRKKDPVHRARLSQKAQRRAALERARMASSEPDSAIEVRRPTSSLHRARMAAVLLAGIGAITATRREPNTETPAPEPHHKEHG